MKRFGAGDGADDCRRDGADLVVAQPVGGGLRRRACCCCWSRRACRRTRNGSQRWIDLGFIRPAAVRADEDHAGDVSGRLLRLAARKKVSRPFWVLLPVLIILVPTALVLRQPDLGTSILLLTAGGGLMFLAGVHWAYFATVIAAGARAGRTAVFASRGTTLAVAQRLSVPAHRHLPGPRADPWARAITSRSPRSRWARAAGPGAASCRARNRG